MVHSEIAPRTTVRAWTVQVTAKPIRIICTSPACPRPVGLGAADASIRASVLTHLAEHAHAEAIPEHLRTCRLYLAQASPRLRRTDPVGPVPPPGGTPLDAR